MQPTRITEIGRRGFLALRPSLILALAALFAGGVCAYCSKPTSTGITSAGSITHGTTIAEFRDIELAADAEEQSNLGRRGTVEFSEAEVDDVGSVKAKRSIRDGRVGLASFESDRALALAGGKTPLLMAWVHQEIKKQPPPIIEFPSPDDKGPKKPPVTTAPPTAAPTTSVPTLPGPRPLFPFSSRQVRLPLLGDPAVEALGTVAPPVGVELDAYKKYVYGMVDPTNTLELIHGRTRMLMLKLPPKRIQVATEATISVTTSGAADVVIAGNQVGTTVMSIWFTAADDKKKEAVLTYLVRVAPDPEAKFRLERAYKGLETEINQTFPDSKLQIKLIGDAIVVSGQAQDQRQADLMLRILVANAPGDGKAGLGVTHPKVVNMLRIVGGQPSVEAKTPAGQVFKSLENEINAAFPLSKVQLGLVGDSVIVSGAAPHRREAAQILQIVSVNTPNGAAAPTSANVKVVDRLRVVGAEQIMLRVVVMELNRSAAASRFGGNVSLPQQTGCIDKGRALACIGALKQTNCARLVAEPNVVTMDGQAATFEAGGQFVIPASGGGAPAVLPYGVKMSFTPTILDHDRIRLEVSASVSAKDSAGKSTSSGVNSRGFSSTIEMTEGQTLSVAGLTQSTSGASRSVLLRGGPDEQEIVILITPELVRPPVFVEPR